jgi:hypothetical protein
MSTLEFKRRSKRSRRECVGCHERKARFRYRGAVRADRDHTLCFECYRSEVNRCRSLAIASRVLGAVGRVILVDKGQDRREYPVGSGRSAADFEQQRLKTIISGLTVRRELSHAPRSSRERFRTRGPEVTWPSSSTTLS